MAEKWNCLIRVMDTSVTQCTCGFRGYKNHKGADLIPKSTSEIPDILAYDDGLVIYAQNINSTNNSTDIDGCGTFVAIRHDDCITRYQHLKFNSLKVKVGDRVKQGQVIGKYGRPQTTGNSTGPHLHFDISFPAPMPNSIKGSFCNETRYYVDPKPFLTGMTNKNEYKVLHDVNVRKSPSTKAEIVSEYKKNEKVEVIDTQGVWVKTSLGWCNNNNGYFFKKL